MMPTKYWIKLYHEILDDPKCGKMPEWLFARFIKLLLMAGREDKDGLLPAMEDMLWVLRPIAEDKFLETLRRLSEMGIAHQDQEGRWCITNFGKRQGPIDPTAAERMRRYREKRNVTRNVTGNVPVTISVSSSVSVSDSVFKTYESEIGILTPTIADSITAELEQENTPEEWINLAIGISARNNKRSWAYVKAILDRWKREGFQSDKRLKPEERGTLAALEKELQQRGYQN